MKRYSQSEYETYGMEQSVDGKYVEYEDHKQILDDIIKVQKVLQNRIKELEIERIGLMEEVLSWKETQYG